MKNFKSVATLSLVLLVGVCATQTTHAMVAFDQANLNPLAPGVLGGALDGVGRMTITSSPTPPNGPLFPGSPGGQFAGYCSANLLSGGQYAITAAHCVGSGWTSQLEFMGGTVTRNVTQYYQPGGWRGDTYGSDIAILRLDAPVTTIQGYELATNSVLGQSVLMAGFGWSGTGDSGVTQPWGTGYFGYNRYDVMLTERGSQSLNGAIYGFDFDNGLINQDTNCFLFSVCDLGLGSQEASVARGDSGGGSFVWNGSQWLLAGIHSHTLEHLRQPCSFDASQNCGDINDRAPAYWSFPFDSSFGEVFWDASVAPHLDWIQNITSRNQVAEPSVLALFGMAFLMVAFRARKVPVRSSVKVA